jgi:ABC-type multidrug transport system ATPase subunit
MTFYLLGQTGSFANRRIVLAEGRVVIGRDSQCHIVLPQAVISRLQAVIEVTPQDKIFIQNQSPKETTFVNGVQVLQCELQQGDVVGFGSGGMVSFVLCKESFENDETNLYAHQGTIKMRVANNQQIRIGRALDNDVVLDSSGISRHHAVLSYENSSQPMLIDLNSSNGTFINGELVTEPRMLQPRDLIFIGSYLLFVEGREITKHDLSASRITALNVTKQIGDKTILKDISLSFYPREFVGLMGPSGCGKSTLMDALNGLRPATSGKVFVNDLDLYLNFDSMRRSIGYVPQKDVLHEALTVERTLFYAAKMRLPQSSSKQSIQQVVNEVIETVGLNEQRNNPFKQLSGGQQKRLSLGIELITKPSFIFLDEPTSPLDPETTENMMLLFRRLADEGRIVVMVTHKFEKFQEMHHIVMLTKGGRLAFFGTPQESLSYFGVKEPGEIYHRIAEQEPEHWERLFKTSKQHEEHISKRINETDKLLAATKEKGVGFATGQGGAEKKFGFSQWFTLTRRYLEIKLKDKRNTLLLLAQAPLVAFILAMITGSTPNDSKTLFIAAIIAIWFGANNAIREIVSESTIYTRERLVNLKIPSYVFSKFVVLSGIGLIQCLLFISILVGMGKLKGADFFMLTLILYATLLAGVTMGLFFSALVSSTEKAMSILPLILIPQLLLSGFLKPIDDLHVNLKTGKPATAEAYRKYEDEKKKETENKNAPPPKALLEPITKYEGLGGVKYVAALMIARWTVDALSHQVSIADKEARDKLAASLTVVEYQKVLDKKADKEIEAGYRKRVWFVLCVLGLFNALFLALTIFALKRKDVL